MVFEDFGFSEQQVKQYLNEAGLDKVANKAFVLLGMHDRYDREEVKMTEMSNNFQQLFKGGVYKLRKLYTTIRNYYEPLDKFHEDSEYRQFTRFIQDVLLEQFQAGQLPTLAEQEQRAPARAALEQRMGDFYQNLNNLRPALAQEFLEIVTQLQSK